MTRLLIGTYPAEGLGAPVGTGEGVWELERGADGTYTATQVTRQDAPSFVAVHPSGGYAYAVEESSSTCLSVLALDGEVREVARVDVGGESGCHVLLAADASAAYVCNYGTGELAVVALDARGLPLSERASQVWSHHGHGPVVDRQEGPHAHFAALSPGGTHVLVADLGTDQVRRYRVGPDGLLSDPGVAALLPAGAGPRHLAVRGELIYAVCELDHTVRTLRWDAASASADVIAELPATLSPHRTGSRVHDAHVELVRRDRGDVVLVSVRGVDVISMFDVAPEGELTYRAALDVGYWPRHFATVDGALIVGAEKGHEVRIYALDEVLALPPESENGALATLGHQTVAVTSPACVVAVPQAS